MRYSFFFLLISVLQNIDQKLRIKDKKEILWDELESIIRAFTLNSIVIYG